MPQPINYEPVSWFFVFDPPYRFLPIVQEFSYSPTYAEVEIKEIVTTYLENVFRKAVFNHIFQDRISDAEKEMLIAANNQWFYATNNLTLEYYVQLPK